MMATISKESIGNGDGSLLLVTYLGITEADTNLPALDLAEWGDRSVHVWGTFNAGTIIIEGSNNKGVSYAGLTDAQGNPLSFTSEKIEQMLELTQKARPRVTAGTGVNLNVAFLLRRASNMRA